MASNFLRKRRVFCIKQETTPGTAESLTTSEAMFCFDPIVQAEIGMSDRAGTGSLSAIASVPGARKGTATFTTEVFGDGTTSNPAWFALFNGCGMLNTSGTVVPTSDSANHYPTYTVGVYESGVFKVISGAMGTWALEAEVGKPVQIKWTFTGIWNAPTDASNVALPTIITPPAFLGATLTLNNGSSHTPLGVSKLSLEMGNTVTLIEDATKASGYSRAFVTGRKLKGKLDPIAETVASWNVWNDWITGTTAALNLVIGGGTHKTITISGPAAQYANIQEGNRNDVVTHDIDFNLVSLGSGSPPTFDDEISIVAS